ncbi:hypothetical protein KC316_g21161 [Hortaea werneckii]|nr:hypothetical protein KC334_g21389 [Hortaea werneckii]KAI7516265.1 hypothetical protein KC316_g21161 [Hortaea werneckii]
MRSLWPFRRKTKDGDKQQALNEKTPPPRPQAAAMPAPPPSSSHPRSSSKRRRPSQNETTTEGQSVKSSRRQGSAVGKENVIPGRDNRGSVEDITALPLSRRLDSNQPTADRSYAIETTDHPIKAKHVQWSSHTTAINEEAQG